MEKPELLVSTTSCIDKNSSDPDVFGGDASARVARLHRMLQVAHGAVGFAEAHGFDTYDISDAKGTPLVLWSYKSNHALARLVRLGMFGGMYLAPVAFRKLLGVTRSRYPHGSAMLACAYMEIAKATGQEIWIHRAQSLLKWLLQNQAQAPVGECWGASFPWYSYGGITPTSVGNAHSTIWAANAFFNLHKLSGDDWALEHCRRSCDFLAYGLNPTYHASGSQSNSYTVLDKSQCINVNADSASILIRLGALTPNDDYTDIGLKMLRFVIENQAPDGSWSYDVPVVGKPWTDGYHTGMVLSALTQILVAHPLDGLKNACEAALGTGAEFYLGNLFDYQGRPLYAVGQLYPIDPYSCGQGIITLIDLCRCKSLDPSDREKAQDVLHKLVDQTLSLMLDRDGSFFTARYRWRIFRLKSLRWAQAVLALAIFRYAEFLLQGLMVRGNDNFDSTRPRT